MPGLANDGETEMGRSGFGKCSEFMNMIRERKELRADRTSVGETVCSRIATIWSAHIETDMTFSGVNGDDR